MEATEIINFAYIAYISSYIVSNQFNTRIDIEHIVREHQTPLSLEAILNSFEDVG